MPDSPYSIQLCAAPDSDKACRLLDFLYGTDREFFFAGTDRGRHQGVCVTDLLKNLSARGATQFTRR